MSGRDRTALDRNDRSPRLALITGLLTRGVARVFDSGKIPGVGIADELLARAEKYGVSVEEARAMLDYVHRQYQEGRFGLLDSFDLHATDAHAIAAL